MSRVPLLALLLLLFPALAGCGKREVQKARPLWPALYEIDAEDVPRAGQFIRYAPPGPKGGGLDVAVTTYASKDPALPKVQLVGVVHIADALYYKNVQKVLDRADLVLYEAIKPEGQDITTWRAGMEQPDASGMAGFQQELASWFGFTYQLDGIDYSSTRFVHADMTAEAFIAEGGQALLEELPGAPGQVASEEMDETVRVVLEKIRAFGRTLLSEPNPIRSLARRMMAEVMGSIDEADMLGMFPGLDELVVVRRNEVAIEKLLESLDKTKGTIAIFYGAAHNRDFEKRLDALGYRRSSAFWLRAWALRPPLR